MNFHPSRPWRGALPCAGRLLSLCCAWGTRLQSVGANQQTHCTRDLQCQCTDRQKRCIDNFLIYVWKLCMHKTVITNNYNWKLELQGKGWRSLYSSFTLSPVPSAGQGDALLWVWTCMSQGKVYKPGYVGLIMKLMGGRSRRRLNAGPLRQDLWGMDRRHWRLN